MANRRMNTKVGSRKALTAQLIDANGPIDLTAVTTVTCRAAAEEGGAAILNGTATIVTANLGKVSYTPSAIEANAFVPGQYPLEWVLSFSGTPIIVPDDGHDTLLIEDNLAP